MSDAAVLMYSSSWCPYCARARNIFEENGVAFEEIDVDLVSGSREEMIRRSGRRTVPQIFVGETHVGGSDDLAALVAAGTLDSLLGRVAK